MAMKGYGFKNRFPFAGLFLAIAIVISIPLTVWSLNNVSTVTKQQAQAPRCGVNNQNPACGKGFVCKFKSNNPMFGGNCMLESLDIPSNLKSNATCEYNLNSPNNATINLSWDKTTNATAYIIDGYYSYVNQGKLVNVNLNAFNSTTNNYTIKIPFPHDVKYFYWKVKAINTYYNVLSLPSLTSAVMLGCTK